MAGGHAMPHAVALMRARSLHHAVSHTVAGVHARIQDHALTLAHPMTAAWYLILSLHTVTEGDRSHAKQ
jgi:hypothetical protein